jgi:hypothetical protein
MSNFMTLEQCSKAELIEIIRAHVSQSAITVALTAIQFRRVQEKQDKADAILEKASNELHAYIEITNKIAEDPKSVTVAERTRAIEHYKNYLVLSEQWNKIMQKERH